MAQFLGTPKVQYFDNNGDPLSGGKLHTYEVGTTTNKASYPTIADAEAQTNANANPVILDSRGEADVVLLASTKLVLTDSADVQIWSVANVSTETSVIDSTGNVVLAFGEVASAVNNVQITNSATSSGPIIEVEGSDSAVDMNFQAKGSGVYAFKATSATAAEVRLHEDTDNGLNYMSLKAPSAVTTSTSLELPDGDGASGQLLSTNGSGVLGWAVPSAVALLSTQVAANTANVSFTSLLTTSYLAYLLVFEDVTPTVDGATLQILLSNDNGSTYVSSAGAYAYMNTHFGVSATTNSGSTSTTALQVGVCGTAAGEFMAGTIHLIHPTSATSFTTLNGNMLTHSTAGVYEDIRFSGYRKQDEDNDAIRIQFSSGNLNTGRISLYGFSAT